MIPDAIIVSLCNVPYETIYKLCTTAKTKAEIAEIIVEGNSLTLFFTLINKHILYKYKTLMYINIVPII